VGRAREGAPMDMADDDITPPVTVRQTEISDFEALRDALQDAPIEIVQLEHGKMSGTMTHMSVGSLGISTGNFTRSVRARGVQSKRRWMIGMVLDAPASIQHVNVIPGDHLIIAPDHEIYTHYPTANRYVATFITPSELFAFLDSQQLGAADAATWQRSSSMLETDPAIAAANAMEYRMLLTAIRTLGPTMSAEAADFYKRNVMELATAPFLNGVHYRGPKLMTTAATLVREIDRFLMNAGSRPIHISELCEKFNVGRRRLHRAFIDVLGIPPITFLRRKRLGDVHTALLMAGPAASVRQIAIEHGFVELGRFAAAYRRMFGELPSETLRRGYRGY
jgi:AraC-like DNA-binding protein